MSPNKSFAAKCQPTVQAVDGLTVHQYRGIKYGNITKRFAEPEIVSYGDSIDELECTQFGPICPQVSTDFHHLLRIPEDVKAQESPLSHDEFECLNLDITVPSVSKSGMPVLIWIHGGSQVMTFMPASSPCADTVPFVVNSIKHDKPVIVVFVNYRLNIFAFGDGKGSQNLALKDQRIAIEWVVKHIESFGGDPNNITLAGESAGAVYVHAHMMTGAPARRAILQSGSLYLSPPQNPANGQALCRGLEERLDKEGSCLADAPVNLVVETLQKAGIVSLWLQLTEELSGWENRTSNIDELVIGDVEYESVIWRNGIETMTAADIVACFDSASEQASQLKRLYNIVPDRSTSCKLGALDFINDTRFALPVMELRDAYRKAGNPVYDYVFDQVNPWQASNRAHHAVDLVMLFGNLDLTHNAGAAAVRNDVQNKWLAFCNGEAPWSKQRTYAFGPNGVCGEISSKDLENRRRVQACGLLKEMGPDQYNSIFRKLAAGRISLLN